MLYKTVRLYEVYSLNYVASVVSEVDCNKHFYCFQLQFTDVGTRIHMHKSPQIPKTDGISKTGMETRLEYRMIKYVLWYSVDSLVLYKSCGGTL
jgi:hypothetical protein